MSAVDVTDLNNVFVELFQQVTKLVISQRSFPSSEFKVGCEIITRQDFRELSIGFNCMSFPSILRAGKFVALLVPA